MNWRVFFLANAFVFCCKLVFAEIEIPPPFSPDVHDLNILVFTNGMITFDKDQKEKPGKCDVWLNANRTESRGGPQLFEYVNPKLLRRPSFVAFTRAFYRYRSMVQNAESDKNTFGTRKSILRAFVKTITPVGASIIFGNSFHEHDHPWFAGLEATTNADALTEKFVNLWTPKLDEKAGFFYTFMGDFVQTGSGITTKYVFNGMHNWVSFYLNEQDNLITYMNRFLINPINNDKTLIQYDIIHNVYFKFKDFRFNSKYEDMKKNSKIYTANTDVTSRTFMMRTSPVFEFCLYTAIALLNNNYDKTKNVRQHSKHLGIEETFEPAGYKGIMDLLTKEATIAIYGCPIKITVKMAVDRQNNEAYIINGESKSLGKCNFEANPNYKAIVKGCKENGLGETIKHLQRDFARVL